MNPVTHGGPAPESEAATPAGIVLLESKFHAPASHPEHIVRPRLLRRLDEGAPRRLTLVGAPAGYGKSTLLAEWYRTGVSTGRCTWLSLDAQDSDPIIFWTYFVEALRRVEPVRFDKSFSTLGMPGVSLTRVVLPNLINELWALDCPLTLILDDYHTITNFECHESLNFLLRRLPPALRLIIATRSDPPLELGRLRARGDLCELRAGDLSFVGEEVGALLNDALGLGLGEEDLDQLEVRTEGWAAGLYLSALSLRTRDDPSTFIAEFAGDNRQIVAYLGGEVLADLPADVRAFLLQTSILDRFSGSLCDAVVSASGSAHHLEMLEQTNGFVMALDQRGEWYRYHHLFQELLQLELKRTQPDLLPVLHTRAAWWYHAAGDVIAAMRHALAAENWDLAGDLLLEFGQPLHQAGRLATLLDWVDALPADVIAARPPLALIAAWLVAIGFRPREAFERWLAAVEAGGYDGPFHLGEHSRRGATALARASFPFDDVGRALAAAQTAVQETDPSALSYLLAHWSLGQCLYLAGRAADAQAPLEEALRAPRAAQQSIGVIRASADLALVCLDLGEVERAANLAHGAVQLAQDTGLAAHPDVCWAFLALSAVLIHQSRFDQAEAALATRVEPHLPAIRRWPIPYARALLELARVRIARGHRQAARTLVEEARTVIEGCADPGMLGAMLAGLDRRVQHAPRARTELREELTEGELRILRLLASDLNQREIARELYLSVNTVKSHVRAIYAKLAAESRADAVTRARSFALLV